jgi:hypothetical protein
MSSRGLDTLATMFFPRSHDRSIMACATGAIPRALTSISAAWSSTSDSELLYQQDRLRHYRFRAGLLVFNRERQSRLHDPSNCAYCDEYTSTSSSRAVCTKTEENRAHSVDCFSSLWRAGGPRPFYQRACFASVSREQQARDTCLPLVGLLLLLVLLRTVLLLPSR